MSKMNQETQNVETEISECKGQKITGEFNGWQQMHH